MENLSIITRQASIKRLLVYFFWDEDGIVDDYVMHSLKALGEHSSEIIVVVNGEVNPTGYRKLRSVSNQLIIRENYGLDAWAYKAAFETVGYDYLSEFDEVLVTNFTLFGPLFPLTDTFSKMDATPCDFWGLAGYNEKVKDQRDIQHLQSYFVVYRKSLTASRDFRNYWQNLPKIESYVDSVNLHELAQTPYYTDKGYTFASLSPMEKYANISPYNFVISCADRVLVEDLCPFIKRRALYFANGYLEQGASIEKLEHISNFIKSRTDYDINFILENIERTQKPKPPEPVIAPPIVYPEPITRYRHYKRLLGSYIHPRKDVRDLLKHLLWEEAQPRPVIVPQVVPQVHEPHPLWERYLNCFRRQKHCPHPVQPGAPRIQHVGRYSYAAPDTHIQSVSTVIGSFCSIGQRVVIGHGKHPKDYLSSSPFFYFDELGFKTREMPTYDEYWYIEPVIIGNDVWIGDGAWIKNGVTIGDGAIIGARAVVTKNVPPYAIVAGVPADVIDYRFSEETISALLESKWWDLPVDVIHQIPFDDIEKAVEFLSGIKRKLTAAENSEQAKVLPARKKEAVVSRI
ncbi:chloramphenicol acetyltransferase [Enterobacter sp. Ap-1006]|uniref:rhamnan synthesis F family protein n=1 Tax=Enterobacter sp. Ap-1006 TaxID=2608345 RepID=UPI00142170C6|nr:rhamnan synthesis F family protein [Enterobacter sp. Ap-1006]NIF46870.1 chloramphenicol acetyltransferase [Enterobacter sp. Ap-1006]